MSAIITGATFLLGLTLAAAGQQEPKTQEPLEAVALKGTAIQSIALAANGDILAATPKGLWRISGDGRSEAVMPGIGLPRPMEQCFVSDVKVSPGGDVFFISGADGLGGRGRDGIYRQSAKGGGWQLVGANLMPLKIDIERIAALAIAADGTLFAATSYVSGYVGASKVFRLYRSTDNGASWQEITHGRDWHSVYFLAAGPQGQLWLGGGFSPHWYYALITDNGRVASPEWRLSAINPKNQDGTNNHVHKVAFDSKGGIYALVPHGTRGSDEFLHGIYRSADKGATWRRLTEPGLSAEFQSLAVNPDDHVYYSTWGTLRRTQDGGTTWKDFASLGRTWVSGILFDAKGHLWASSDGWGRSGFGDHGLFRSKEPVGKGVVSVTPPDGIATKPPQPPDGIGTRPQPTPPRDESVVLDGWNKANVSNGPTAPTQFTLKDRCLITYVDTYHWNNGKGKTPGTIGLRHQDGTMYGPWAATGLPGQGGVPNAYWVVRPNMVLKPGTITVVDSDPVSWSQNIQSQGRGFSLIKAVCPASEEDIEVPNLLRFTREKAQQELAKLGLILAYGAAPAANDLVKTQDPVAGTKVAPGAKVQVVFASLSEIIADELAQAKAKSGDVQISLFWTNKSDLDLHVVSPSGETILYSNRKSKCGGELDIDCNAQYGSATANAVENIYWPKGKAPAGKYKVYVDFYSSHNNAAGCLDPSAFSVRILAQGKSQVFQGTVGSKTTRKVLVHEFDLSADKDDFISKVKVVPPKPGPVPQSNFGYQGNVVIQGNLVPELSARLHFTIKGDVMTGSLEATPICEPNRRLPGAAVQLQATLPAGFQWEGSTPMTGTITGDVVGCPERTPILKGSTFTLAMKGKMITLTTTGLYYNTYQFGTPMGQVYTVRDIIASTGAAASGYLVPYSEVSKQVQQAFGSLSVEDIAGSSGVLFLEVGQSRWCNVYSVARSASGRTEVIGAGPPSIAGNPHVDVSVVSNSEIKVTGKSPGYSLLRLTRPINVKILTGSRLVPGPRGTLVDEDTYRTEWITTAGNFMVAVKLPPPLPPGEKTLAKVTIRGRAIRRDNQQPVAGALVQLIADRGKGTKYPPPTNIQPATGGFVGVAQGDTWKTDANGEFTIVAENMIPQGQFEIFLIRYNPDPDAATQRSAYEQDLWPVKYYLLNVTQESAERGPYDVGTIVMDTVEHLWGAADRREQRPTGTGRQGIEWRGPGAPKGSSQP